MWVSWEGRNVSETGIEDCRANDGDFMYEGWNFKSGTYLFTIDTK